MLRSLLKRFLHLLGKSDHKIIAVFVTSGGAWREAVDHVRAGTRPLPIWLVTSIPVEEETSQNCERVLQVPQSGWGALQAARALWPNWVALNVTMLTRERGYGWLKTAPLLVPPWRLLVMNEHGDFFSAWPAGLLRHVARRLRDRLLSGVVSVKDVAAGIFWKLMWTLLDPVLERTSAPWRRPPECPALAFDTMQRRPGVLVWVANAAVSRRVLRAALERLGAPYEMAGGSLPDTTHYEYLLAVEETPAGDLRDLVKLLERPGTFAASFQFGRAGFQKDVVPRAPFRQLQPGEATAVVAPLPGVVLVDARKLGQLGGFPRARSRRCRWLMLYWRAAAAGWRSYSLGVECSPLPMIPDRAYAEAEFCFRLLRARPEAPAESQPAPARLDARRGSVCFHPLDERPLRSGTRRILIVSPYLPFPLSHGGAVRIFNLARHLSERWDLILITFRERNDHVDYGRLSSCFGRLIVVDHDERRRKDPSAPEAAVQFRSQAMAAAIREAVEEYRPDLLQVEYTQMAEYREAAPNTPAVLVEHDVTFSLYEQLAGSDRAAQAEFERWHRFESHWLKHYDAVAVMSEEEKSKAAGAGAEPDRLWVVPNGVDTERFCPALEDSAAAAELLYVGSFRHLPNILGFEYLRQQILPPLWEESPKLRVRVVAGPEYERHWRAFSRRAGGRVDLDPRVQIEGFVENLAPYYARAQVVVVPLVVSAGTNIKVLEAVSCGKPVVSTPIGCAGLGLVEKEEILVASDAEGFRAAVRTLLNEPALRQRLGERARRAAVERYSWERSAAQAAEMCEAVCRRWPAGQIKSRHVIRNSPL